MSKARRPRQARPAPAEELPPAVRLALLECEDRPTEDEAPATVPWQQSEWAEPKRREAA